MSAIILSTVIALVYYRWEVRRQQWREFRKETDQVVAEILKDRNIFKKEDGG